MSLGTVLATCIGAMTYQAVVPAVLQDESIFTVTLKGSDQEGICSRIPLQVSLRERVDLRVLQRYKFRISSKFV